MKMLMHLPLLLGVLGGALTLVSWSSNLPADSPPIRQGHAPWYGSASENVRIVTGKPTRNEVETYLLSWEYTEDTPIGEPPPGGFKFWR